MNYTHVVNRVLRTECKIPRVGFRAVAIRGGYVVERIGDAEDARPELVAGFLHERDADGLVELLSRLRDVTKVSGPPEEPLPRNTPPRRAKACCHCGRPYLARTGRGLCRACWSNPATRKRYPIVCDFGGEAASKIAAEVLRRR